MKKKPNPSLLSKEEQRKKKKTKVLTLNKYMAMGPSGARCQESPCWLVAGSKLLLCSASQLNSAREAEKRWRYSSLSVLSLKSGCEEKTRGWCEMAASLGVS
jgi:hypothetical protein